VNVPAVVSFVLTDMRTLITYHSGEAEWNSAEDGVAYQSKT
jgi:hypothetical protein